MLQQRNRALRRSLLSKTSTVYCTDSTAFLTINLPFNAYPTSALLGCADVAAPPVRGNAASAFPSLKLESESEYVFLLNPMRLLPKCMGGEHKMATQRRKEGCSRLTTIHYGATPPAIHGLPRSLTKVAVAWLQSLLYCVL